jgi:leader peptidase (prepilin peptidase) / N-methyltransferase
VTLLLIALLGLAAGSLLNRIIARQLDEPIRRLDGAWQHWLPLVGTIRRRDWIALTVEIASAIMAVLLVQSYGLGTRSLFLFGASLVLIDTGVIDFKIRMIDTLVLVVATVLALLLAPVNELHWVRAVAGFLLAGLMFLFFFVLAKVLFRGVDAPFGLGDVYLAAFIGALAGFYALPYALFYGMALAGGVALVLIIMRSLGRSVPMYISYGTYLCLGALFFLASGVGQ